MNREGYDASERAALNIGCLPKGRYTGTNSCELCGYPRNYGYAERRCHRCAAREDGWLAWQEYQREKMREWATGLCDRFIVKRRAGLRDLPPRPGVAHDEVSGCALPARTVRVTRCNCAACRETRRLEAEKWDEPRISAPPQPCALWVGGEWKFFPIGRYE